MEIESLFGLPAHPLVVHAAVVLLPLGALGAIVVALHAGARRRLAIVVAGVCIVATAAVGLAQQSGEALEENVRETQLVEAHTHQGETVLPWAIVLSVLAVAVAARDPLVAAQGTEGSFASRLPALDGKAITTGLAALVLIVSIGATWSVTVVGHSGAKATWNTVATESR